MIHLKLSNLSKLKSFESYATEVISEEIDIYSDLSPSEREEIEKREEAYREKEAQLEEEDTKSENSENS